MEINKEHIKELCLNHIEGKIGMIEAALQETQASANSDTKSSAGDKHETSRAMAHIENERLAKQLSNLISQKVAVTNINPENKSESVKLGSYVVTDKGDFFIAVGLGKIGSNELAFFAIAMNSPIGKLISEKKAGDIFEFNNGSNKILAVY